MYVKYFFELDYESTEVLRRLVPQFGYNGFGEVVYYRSYSRTINGRQEQWADTVIRVINGVMSIRKDWYVKNHINWDEAEWQLFAFKMALSLFKMEWLPPGRGLWAMGTQLIYERGAMPLYNCAFTNIGVDWVGDLCWLMDLLMNGCGVGFEPKRLDHFAVVDPFDSFYYVIPDTREGWVESMRMLLRAFLPGGRMPIFDYDDIRQEGTPIKSFGGLASGPSPLRDLHNTVTKLCYRKVNDDSYDQVAFFTDIANLIGVCVVTGNIRRSAELACAPISDPVFMGLKDYTEHNYRAAWGWMSNNSVKLEKAEDFESLDEVALRCINGHDVGYLNMLNFPQGRIGHDDGLRVDKAVGINPCGEIPLEHREVCNVSETLPTRCVNFGSWLKACEYATYYCSTVALLPTHQASTNAIVIRNRRIGVGIIDFVGWKAEQGLARVTRYMRDGYKTIREFNRYLAEEAGVPESIRVTTIKPGGSVPKMPGRRSAIGHSNFRYQIRRIRVQQNTPIEQLLIDANVPHEPDAYSKQTTVFEFPVFTGDEREAAEVSLWEQAMNLVLVQREWADNAVSNTLNFNRETESEHVAPVLAAIAPLTKSVSLLPHSTKGIYVQMPEEGISKEEFELRLSRIKDIDWSLLNGHDGEDERFCQGDACAAPAKS